jgi:hypothetical protein
MNGASNLDGGVERNGGGMGKYAGVGKRAGAGVRVLLLGNNMFDSSESTGKQEVV